MIMGWVAPDLLKAAPEAPSVAVASRLLNFFASFPFRAAELAMHTQNIDVPDVVGSQAIIERLSINTLSRNFRKGPF